MKVFYLLICVGLSQAVPYYKEWKLFKVTLQVDNTGSQKITDRFFKDNIDEPFLKTYLIIDLTSKRF